MRKRIVNLSRNFASCNESTSEKKITIVTRTLLVPKKAGLKKKVRAKEANK